jgi:SEC-C motif
MRVGRNEPCSCGSRKKFKNCCEGKARRAWPKGLLALLAAFLVIAAVAFFPRGEDSSSSASSVTAPATPSRTRPGPQPGPAPPGKVWSAEHGHWHDIGASPTTPAASPIRIEQTSGVPLRPTVGSNVPQPAGPVPPGKVWSPEHGHWHDAPK